MISIGAQLKLHGNFGPGFNFNRITLAYAVMVWHTVTVAQDAADAVLKTPLWSVISAILPMFFALSGFLVTASALRLPLREYILNRAFRIIPALAVDIVFCALIIGPIFTSFQLADYFVDRDFYEYFLNIIGLIHYDLPGVFLDNPHPTIVNGSLWTVPYEIACYVLMSLMIWFGIIQSWRWVFGVAVVMIGITSFFYLTGIALPDNLLGKIPRFLFAPTGGALLVAFVCGSGFYLIKDHIPYSRNLALLIALGIVGLGFFGDPALFTNPIVNFVAAFPLAYLVIWIGSTPIAIPKFLERGDYSYGIYLYHVPVLQSLQSLFHFSSWWTLTLAAIVPVTVFAMMSWHFIEKPVLKMRRRFSLVGARLANGGQSI